MTALWLTVALMTGAAVFVVLGSLARRREVSADAAEADVAVYRDQIDEIARDRARGLIDERDHARGLIDERDADSARVEVARRLIAASDRG
ncbi:c-type cytochrome biogenesis protein CcmI, partial [Hansschlegelia beijingensis]|uniref:c-type cytochrome biogenesis protein CcmI n=1 Tax=Hansschlegelia beijingensis TaxID=1133344 RepID=UPI00387F12BD